MRSIRVCSLGLLAALCSVAVAQAQTTALVLDSQAGDYIGQGVQRTYLPQDATFSISGTPDSQVAVSVVGPSFSFYWSMRFAAPNGVPLTVGTYPHARRLPFTTGNAMDISSLGRGCNQLTGQFVVLELVTAPDNSISRFAADFEQHCEDAGPGLFGAIRFNSTISSLTPFGGNYPRYDLTFPSPTNGRVTGGGLDCGSGGSVCSVAFAVATHVTLTATPDAGHVFTGWTGDCRGAQSTQVHVNSAKSCSALFEPLASASPRTLLFLDDHVAVPARQQILSLANSQWTVTSDNGGNHINVGVRDENRSWRLDFSAPRGQALVAASYYAVARYPFTPLSGLSISGADVTGCNRLNGRFVVHEIALATDGTVLRFAADFEQHCEGSVPGVFGAVRYNATFDPVVPFDGAYPVYQLAVFPPAHGRVTGGGIDCGGSGTLCEVVLPGADTRTLTAVPDAGYVFAGWTGDCRGWTTTSVHVNGPKICQALFDTAIASSPRTLFFYESQVSTGTKQMVASATSRWNVTSSNNGNRVSVFIDEPGGGWSVDLSAPEGQPLTVGYYAAARRYPFTTFNGLSAPGGCNTHTGRFVVLDIAIAANGTVERLAADFEQHCEDAVPGVFGAIRYNSMVDEVLPFGGNYPLYQVSLTPAANGTMTGTGITCGGAQTQCAVNLGAAAQVTLVATPNTGYVFMGWTDDCSGGTTTTLHVNGPKRCSARFDPSVDQAPRTVLRWDSQPGHWIGQGRSEVYSPANSRWRPSIFQNGNGVEFQIDSVDPLRGSTWTLVFRAPAGELLQAGRRYVAPDSFSAPGARLQISGNGRICLGGEFTVRQISMGAQPSDLRFAVDFVMECGTQSTSYLTGSLQYQSTVDSADAILTFDPASLRFATLHNRVAVIVQPAPQTVRVTITRPNVGWTAAANQSWLELSPASGTGSSALTVAPNLLGAQTAGGSLTGLVTVTLTDGSGVSKTIPVTVTLHSSGTTAAPFGFVDTPAPVTAGVTGAVPITGWALDDVEVTGVTVCRAAVGAEAPPLDPNCGGTAQIFVGSAVFIEGSRPDVQTGFPTHPRNNLGGWGFMMLTNTLPNQGNGPFVFHVYARDREGHVALLGTRTMTCDNEHASAPFGAIDTPSQGETISGNSFVNFGWALTQSPKHIPTDGSTLMVYVDGVAIGSPSYNHFRGDIAAIFPGLANSNGAVGFKIIDTTTLTNGLHTIVWTATDSAGTTSGLGSRFFRVANGVAGATAPATAATTADALAAIPLDPTPLAGRRGWHADAPWRGYGIGAAGRAVLRGEEIDRIELALGERTGETHSGYLRVGDELGPLPVGSSLDRESGAFTWSPGVGFVGAYDLVFIRSAGSRPVARREVRIILHAKGSGHVGAQAAIDTPRSQQDIAQPFALGGWAADVNAATGTGIDTLHVWAYPQTGAPPVFLGTATYGGARPDVAAIHGDAFRDSGFGLTIQGLTPGNYELAVFPWSNVSNGFTPPQVVRITVR